MTSQGDTTTSRHELLRTILKQVSRSFYLTLIVVPSNVRDQMGLSYLFARAADTIADTDLIERSRRLLFLKTFRAQFAGDRIDPDAIRALQDGVAPHQKDSGERTLLQRLEECFRVYRAFAPEDRRRIQRLMTTLTNGMEMDLTVFSGDSAHALTALQTLEDLDRYIYYVAGCVGEFWTGMMCLHRRSLRGWDETEMSRIGVRFGKGLQLTNVLKDLARDLQRGRCYIPEPMLREVGLTPSDLLEPDSLPKLRPVLARLLAIARDHLDQGWAYTMAIPRRDLRLRLACMWPILFAGGTLRDVAASPDLLNPAVNVKISKSEVRRIMALTMLTAGCGYTATALWGHLRKQIV